MGNKTRQWHIDNTYRSLIEERDNWRWQFDNCAEVTAELQAEINQLRAALHLAAGLLSSCAPYDQMHPNRVLELLTDERHHDHHEST